MNEVTSFDIFDTLLARTVECPTDIFDIIEKNFPYTNFRNIRLQAQRDSNDTINSIYNEFKNITNELIGLFSKRVYDIAACTNKNVKVFLNETEIKLQSFSEL